MISLVRNIDCMVGMAEFPDKFFDLAIVDPPYGIGADFKNNTGIKQSKHSATNSKKYGSQVWDNNIPDDEYFTQLVRISKHQIIWGANYFVEHLHKGTKGWVVWYKGQEGLTMSDAELAYSSFDCATRVVKINRVELLKDGTIHPTQKPVKLYKWLLENYAKKDWKILDTHLGSGSIAIACWDMGYDLTAYEVDKEYFDNACKRLETHKAQLTLW